MSHRKYEAPRHGSLAYLPKKRASSVKARMSSYPTDDPSQPVHLTNFFGYKAGMTHVLRVGEREGSKLAKKEIIDAVTVIETPPCVVFGMLGYKRTPQGLQCIKTVISEHINENVKRRFYKRYVKSKKNAFSTYGLKYQDGEIERDISMIREQADVVRVLIHSQIEKIKGIGAKKAHIMESQLNGGDVQEKIDFALEHFEKEIPVSELCRKEEMLDLIGVTKGKGFQGCPKRWGTTILPRKSNKGIRKVACIGAWHPSRVMYTVARAGQLGFHHRVQVNKRVYMVGNGTDGSVCKTEFDLTEKGITPMGGFVGYGEVRNDFVMVKGSVVGPRKRVVILRRVEEALGRVYKGKNTEKITLKFIDTSSKMGSGRFQTSKEKTDFYGKLKVRASAKEEYLEE
jgi:large subunit ribosomal protein L3e